MTSVRTEVRGRALWITLDRPEARNALDLPTLDALGSAWSRLQEDDALWVGVITGAGDKAFCVGGDLKVLASQQAARAAAGDPGPGGLHVSEVEKPVIAAINGDALGGGLELVLCCDIRIAATSARFGLTEARWGLLPAGGGTQRLPQLIPAGRAIEMMLTAEVIGAAEALSLGLLSAVVPHAELAGAAEATAAKVLRNAPLSVQAIKRAVRRSREAAIGPGLALEKELLRRLHATADGREGPRAFSEDRPPRWSGK